jgi:uncharacterized protein (TIGR02145 family)
MKIVSIISILLISFSFISFSQTVTIGTQVWMDKNLDVSTFRNGDPIKQVKSNEEWQKAETEGVPAWCYYENKKKNNKKYGKLFNWYAVNDPRGIAPVGYHVPTETELYQLSEYLSPGEEGANAGKKMKSTNGWQTYEGKEGNGTNESGFNGLPGGFRTNGGMFSNQGDNGYWFSATEGSKMSASTFELYNRDDYFSIRNYRKGGGFSVRCVKD